MFRTMPNLRVQNLTSAAELHLCDSEPDDAEDGFSLALDELSSTATTVKAERLADGGLVLDAEPGFSGECCTLFHGDELLGDVRRLEITREYTRIVYAPVPPVE